MQLVYVKYKKGSIILNRTSKIKNFFVQWDIIFRTDWVNFCLFLFLVLFLIFYANVNVNIIKSVHIQKRTLTESSNFFTTLSFNEIDIFDRTGWICPIVEKISKLNVKRVKVIWIDICKDIWVCCISYSLFPFKS